MAVAGGAGDHRDEHATQLQLCTTKTTESNQQTATIMMRKGNEAMRTQQQAVCLTMSFAPIRSQSASAFWTTCCDASSAARVCSSPLPLVPPGAAPIGRAPVNQGQRQSRNSGAAQA